MSFKNVLGLAVATLVLNMSILNDANAASVAVKCRASAGRSKISVDGAGLSRALYRASVRSGAAAAILSKNLLAPVGGEVEFDFDSNNADVLAGATRIPSTFIKNNRVVGNLYKRNSNGTLSLVASMAATCR
jgi:hypothetical protein